MSIKTICECIIAGRTLTHTEKKVYIEKYAITKHGKKLIGIQSISTSVLHNERCQKRRECDGTICKSCYAAALAGYRKELAYKLFVNLIFFTTYTLTKKDIPEIKDKIFRFESFGDLATPLQFYNYCIIARYNKKCFFVLWTKNPDIIEKALDVYGISIPKNLRIILSETYLNKPCDASRFRKLKKKYPFISKIFSVFDKKYIEKNGIEINCGGKRCIDCMICYDKSNRTYLLREKKK